MRKLDRLACEADNRRECDHVERSYERHKIRGANGEAIDHAGVTVDWDLQAAEGRDPAGRIVVPIEVGETEGSDVGQVNSGSLEAFGKRARTDAGVDEQHAGRRA